VGWRGYLKAPHELAVHPHLASRRLFECVDDPFALLDKLHIY